MKKRSKNTQSNLPAGWVENKKITINGRSVEVGTELSIRGESGRFRFVNHMVTPKHEWIDVIGGKKGYEKFRSFRIDSVRTVHRIARTRQSIG